MQRLAIRDLLDDQVGLKIIFGPEHLFEFYNILVRKLAEYLGLQLCGLLEALLLSRVEHFNRELLDGPRANLSGGSPPEARVNICGAPTAQF